MKTHRNILIISVIITLACLGFVIYYEQDNKPFQIALAFMGGSVVSFLLEIPNFTSLKNENNLKLYGSLLDLKSQAMLFNHNIHSILKYYDSIDINFHDNFISKLLFTLNSLKSFDSNFYFQKKRNQIVSQAINNIENAYNNVKQATMKYGINFSRKKMEIYSVEKKERSINPNELAYSLNLISDMCNNLIETIDYQASLLFSKKELIKWKLNDSTLITAINKFKVDEY